MSTDPITALVSPATKLIELVASGIGSAAGHVFAPYIARRHGKALEIKAKHQASALHAIAQALQETRDILDNPDMSLGLDSSISESIEQFVSYQQARRIRNVGSIAYRAAEFLEDVEEVSNDEVDHDWAARFFNEVQDVSSEEMQELWARVLAGQVEKPGSVSRKALDVLRNMDKETAYLFQRLCSINTAIVLPSLNVCVDILAISMGDALGNSLREYGLSFDKLNRLQEYGLIIANYEGYMSYREHLVMSDNATLGPQCVLLHQSDFWVLRTRTDDIPGESIRVSGVEMTRAGKELSSVVDIIPMPEYTESLQNYFKAMDLTMLPSGLDSVPRNMPLYKPEP